MARLKLNLPETFAFATHIPVRITDMNYGGHVGNDTILSLLHEARVQYLQQHQLAELDFAGVGLIMSDVCIEYKDELFYGEDLKAYVTAGDFSRVYFTIYYKLVKIVADKEVVIALAQTGMVCYNYTVKKVVSIPEAAKQLLLS